MNRIQLTADNSNLLLTRSNFCFPSDHFCIIFPRKLELRFKSVKRWEKNKKNKNNNNKKKRCTEIQDIEFNWKQPCHFFVRLYFLSLKFSVHSPVSHIKRCCLIPCSQYQSLFLAAFEVKYAWYLRSFPIHLLISAYLFRTHHNSNFFRFP